METSEVLDRAADLIEERGWVKGVVGWGEEGESAPLCLEGGIVAALGFPGWVSKSAWQRDFWTCPAYRAVAAYIGVDVTLREGMPDQHVYDYNDAPGRTAAEVIEVLRACALIESAREEQDAAWQTYAESVSA